MLLLYIFFYKLCFNVMFIYVAGADLAFFQGGV